MAVLPRNKSAAVFTNRFKSHQGNDAKRCSAEEESGFFTLATAIDASGAVAWYGYRGPYSVSGPEAYKEMIMSVFEL